MNFILNAGSLHALMDAIHGIIVGYARYKKVYSKSAKEWVLKNVYEKKTTHHTSDLLQRTLAARASNTTASESASVKMVRSVAPYPAPPLEELLSKRRRCED